MTTTAPSTSTTTVVTGRALRGARRHAGEHRERGVAWGFLAPFLVAFALFDDPRASTKERCRHHGRGSRTSDCERSVIEMLWKPAGSHGEP